MVTRPHLLELLSHSPNSRLTLIIAPAGYGKTTLLNEWLSGLADRTPIFRYTCSELDNDPDHLITNLAELLPDANLPVITEQVSGPSQLAFRLSSLFNTFRSAVHKPILAFDDYYRVTNPDIHQALDILLGLPAWPVRVVIASRTAPPLNTIARLRVEDSLVEIDERDLSFSTAETGQMLEAYGLETTGQDLQLVTERTEGWAAALRLVCQAAQRAGSAGLLSILEHLGSERHLFDYLAGQVLDNQPAETRTFLCCTSLLPYLNPGLCNAFLNSANAAAILDSLERQHLFITPLDSETGRRYRYHALFNEFLARCLEQEEGSESVKVWRKKAARCLLERLPLEPPGPRADSAIAAIDLLVTAGAWEEAAAAIETAAELLDWGRVILINRWFERIPPEITSLRPGLLAALGTLRERQARWGEALDALARAGTLFRSDGRQDQLGRNLCRQARIHYRQGHYNQAISLCHLALDIFRELLPPEAIETGTPTFIQPPGHQRYEQEIAESYRILGACCYTTGDFQNSASYLDQALTLFRWFGNRQGEALALSNLGDVYFGQGRFVESIEAETSCLSILQDINSYRMCNSLVGLCDIYRLCGRMDEAQEAIDEALVIIDAYHDPLMQGYALFVLGHLQREQGEWKAARVNYERARLLGEELQEPALLAEPRRGLALLSLAEGDLLQAQRHAQLAVQTAQKYGYRLLEGQALLALGKVLVLTGESAKARAALDDARLLLEAMGSNYELVLAYLYLADLDRTEEKIGQALANLERTLDIARQFGHDSVITGREIETALPLLVMALSGAAGLYPALFPAGEYTDGQTGPVWLSQPQEMLNQAGRLLVEIGYPAVMPILEMLKDQTRPVETQVCGVRILGEIGDERAIPALNGLLRHSQLKPAAQFALEKIAAAPPPLLRIHTLGGFQVLRGDQSIPAETWQQRRKIRLLLLYLLIHRHRRVPRDELLETLWPDQSPESAGLALNTTFSNLRRILEPYLGKGLPSRYLIREEETLSFNPLAEIWYDVQEFESAVKSGQAARLIASLYRGEFVPEEPYVDWVIRERERIRALFLNSQISLLEQRVQSGAWREGVDLAKRILEMEPWLEEVWRALMTCYSMLGQRSEALRAFNTCEQVLRNELDIAPSAETRALYEQIK